MNTLTKGALSLSAVGLVMVALFEGYSSTPYFDVGGVLTDGFGNTHNVGKPTTVPKALDTLLRNTSDAGKAVERCILVPLNQNQYDALVSFTYNVGGGNLCSSTLAKKFNVGDKAGGCRELLRWNKVKGVVNKGLVARRQQEYELCSRTL